MLLLALLVAWLPNPGTTPGAVTALTTATLCSATFTTKSVRPPVSYTDALKKKQMAAAKLPGKPSDYEEDHLISLELGGDPRSSKNLWPEPYAGACGARVKDRLEDRLHRLVCTGAVPLKDAQRLIASNWVGAYNRYVGSLTCPPIKR